MRLPTEWEWQAAAETQGEKFVFNKVWEWNESERFDGNNRFVTLRGGCEDWVLKTSRWYFGGGTSYFKNAPGGKEPIDFHCKYFLMYEGMDRAATIGFRCMR
jgi:formylglycine-generating enzyme required for sulfatase activity